MVAREGFVYEQKPLSVSRNVIVSGWSLVRVVVRQGFYCSTSLIGMRVLPLFFFNLLLNNNLMHGLETRVLDNCVINTPRNANTSFKKYISNFV